MEQQQMIIRYGALRCLVVAGIFGYLGIVKSWAFMPVAMIDLITAVGLWTFKDWARKFAVPAFGMQLVTMIIITLRLASKTDAFLFVFTTGSLVYLTYSMHRRLSRPEIRELFN